MTQADIVRIKELRGSILEFLNGCYPRTVARNSVYSTYYEYEDVDDISDCLDYLTEKGYVEEKELKAPFDDFYHMTHYYKISVKGIDLLEGSLEADHGIILPRRS